jgi:hypothetical protein
VTTNRTRWLAQAERHAQQLRDHKRAGLCGGDSGRCPRRALYVIWAGVPSLFCGVHFGGRVGLSTQRFNEVERHRLEAWFEEQEARDERQREDAHRERV